jgi:hypothetical protein
MVEFGLCGVQYNSCLLLVSNFCMFGGSDVTGYDDTIFRDVTPCSLIDGYSQKCW